MKKHQIPLTRCPVCATEIKPSRVLVTIKAAMDKTRVSRSTVRRWMLAHQVDWVTLPRGSPRVYLDSLFEDPPGEPAEV